MWTNELNLLQDKGHCNNLSQSKGVYIKTGVQAVLIYTVVITLYGMLS